MATTSTKGAAAATASTASTAPTTRTPLPLVIVLMLVLIAALVGLDVLGLRLAASPTMATSRHYYMAVGDSLSFGYQPNLNFTNGFADDLGADLRKAYSSQTVDFACAGESTVTMVGGGCPARFTLHEAYTGPQLDAAVKFINQHKGEISPVTLEIGANDVINAFDQDTCAPITSYTSGLTTMDDNLTKLILPRLLDALTTNTGHRAGDLVLLNYYNPFARRCANSADYVKLINQHLTDDAAQFRVPIVDIYQAFGGDDHMADNICTYTWMCNTQYHDIHPTTAGYQIIAAAIETTLNYPGVTPVNPLPALPQLGTDAAPSPDRRQPA